MDKRTRALARIRERTPEQQLNAGYMEFKHGSPKRAIEILERLSKTAADEDVRTAALLVLGKALAKEGMHRAATTKFAKVLSANPMNAEARNAFGESFLAAGNLNAALCQFRIVVRNNPEHAEAHKNLGKAFLKKGAVKRAARCLRNAVELSGERDWEPRYLLAAALHKTGRHVEAEMMADEAMRSLTRVTKTPNKTKTVIIDQKNYAAAAALRARCLRAIKGKTI